VREGRYSNSVSNVAVKAARCALKFQRNSDLCRMEVVHSTAEGTPATAAVPWWCFWQFDRTPKTSEYLEPGPERQGPEPFRLYFFLTAHGLLHLALLAGEL
jgi:hypothetical protein